MSLSTGVDRLNGWRPPMSGSRKARWARAAIGLVVALLIAVVILMNADTQVRTPVGADGVGKGSFPVVEIAGLGSTGSHFAQLTTTLRAEGRVVLDFDSATLGIQPLVYRPASRSEHIPALAVRVVQPAIEAALRRGGFNPRTQVVDVVAHSMGGLLMRFLIEQPGAHVSSFSTTAGWYGGPAAVESNWAARVDDLVMVATPNHGSSVVAFETRFGVFHGLGSDMAPGSVFLRRMGTAEPAGAVYTTIGGDPWEFRWLRYGDHGFDDTVPAESPFMIGAARDTFPYFHGQLLYAVPVVSLVTRTLAAT